MYICVILIYVFNFLVCSCYFRVNLCNLVYVYVIFVFVYVIFMYGHVIMWTACILFLVLFRLWFINSLRLPIVFFRRSIFVTPEAIRVSLAKRSAVVRSQSPAEQTASSVDIRNVFELECIEKVFCCCPLCNAPLHHNAIIFQIQVLSVQCDTMPNDTMRCDPVHCGPMECDPWITVWCNI